MKDFKELGIVVDRKGFVGDKIKISKILNLEVAVLDYKIEDSKYEGKGKCLHLQIELSGNKHVVFIGSRYLIETIQKVPADAFPFKTRIVKNNEWYEFT